MNVHRIYFIVYVEKGIIETFRNSDYYIIRNEVDQIKVDKIDAFC